MSFGSDYMVDRILTVSGLMDQYLLYPFDAILGLQEVSFLLQRPLKRSVDSWGCGTGLRQGLLPLWQCQCLLSLSGALY